MFIRDPKGLWDCFVRHYTEDAARTREVLEKEGALQPGWMGQDFLGAVGVA